MNCSFDKEKLSGYYDGELSAPEKSEVERHIASCSECLRDLGELKSAALMIKELPRLRAPQSIAEGISREIQAAGKVHSLAKFRRLVLWASAAAAALFIVANAIYLTNQNSKAPGADAPLVARMKNSADAEARPAAAPPAEAAKEADRSANQGFGARRQLESRKETGEEDERRAAPKPVVEGKRVDALRERAEAPAPASAKPGEALAKAEPPAPVASAPAGPAAKSAAPLPAPPEVLKTESALAADKEKPAREPEGSRKADADLKGKAAAAAAPAELPPVHYNVMAKEIAKARPRIEESLKRMGITVPLPAPQPMKQPRNREAENTIALDLTDAELLRLREELEKPGDARMVAASSVEPVLPGFRGGGLFAKKDVTTSSKAFAPSAKEKEAKDGDDAAPVKSPADPAAGPRRRVTLHLVEVKSLPPAEGDPK
ncbi:MAG TPA: anti-sigma factor [Planctomycetota bacterium]|nr:anti-sigma factor [Planctomycetota bacterium]